MNSIPKESWISPKVEIRESTSRGRGIFAKEKISKGEKVVVWGGNYVNEEVALSEKEKGKLVMQWDDDLYSVEERGDDDAYYVNHSCEPNLWMSDAHSLVARRDIEEGEEVSADYAVWEANEDYVSSWNCICGSNLCRGKVTGKDWKLSELQAAYTNHFSPLINKKINESK